MPGENPTPAIPDEVLFRNVHPTWIDVNGVQSRAFNPTPKDKGELSVDIASLITAECAFLLFTGRLGYSSSGIWPVTLSKCKDVKTIAFQDPLYAHRSHGFIDFRQKNRT